jgi:plasmid stability protein
VISSSSSASRAAAEWHIRLPHDLAEALKRLAAAHDRSVNAEIVRVLRAYARQQGELPPTAVGSRS